MGISSTDDTDEPIERRLPRQSADWLAMTVLVDSQSYLPNISINSSCLTGIVGAAICRPRATNSRPYDILVKLPVKFKFV